MITYPQILSILCRTTNTTFPSYRNHISLADLYATALSPCSKARTIALNPEYNLLTSICCSSLAQLSYGGLTLLHIGITTWAQGANNFLKWNCPNWQLSTFVGLHFCWKEGMPISFQSLTLKSVNHQYINEGAVISSRGTGIISNN